MEDIKNEILEVLRKFTSEEVIILNESTMEDLNIDSFQFIQFIVEVETIFNIEITDDKLDISEYQTCLELIDSIALLIEEA